MIKKKRWILNKNLKLSGVQTFARELKLVPADIWDFILTGSMS